MSTVIQGLGVQTTLTGSKTGNTEAISNWGYCLSKLVSSPLVGIWPNMIELVSSWHHFLTIQTGTLVLI